MCSHTRFIDISLRYMTVAVITIAMWTSFLLLSGWLRQACEVSCSSFTDHVQSDPSCAIDPTCVSPFYESTKSGVQYWVGLDGWQLSMGQHPPVGWHGLAVFNYVLFILLALAATVLVVRYLPPRKTAIGLVAIYVWCCLEVLKWFFAAATLDTGHISLLPAVGTLMFTLGVLTAGAVLAKAQDAGSRMPGGSW